MVLDIYSDIALGVDLINDYIETSIPSRDTCKQNNTVRQLLCKLDIEVLEYKHKHSLLFGILTLAFATVIPGCKSGLLFLTDGTLTIFQRIIRFLVHTFLFPLLNVGYSFAAVIKPKQYKIDADRLEFHEVYFESLPQLVLQATIAYTSAHLFDILTLVTSCITFVYGPIIGNNVDKFKSMSVCKHVVLLC